MDLYVGLLECPKDMAAGFPPSKKSRKQVEIVMTFMI